MDGIWITREIHTMNSQVREMALDPIDARKVGSKTMLNNDIFTKPGKLGSIE